MCDLYSAHLSVNRCAMVKDPCLQKSLFWVAVAMDCTIF